MTTIFDPVRFSAVSMDVLACGRATAQALVARQQSRLGHLLAAAMRDSRFYRDHLHGMQPGNTPLARLPSVSRHELDGRVLMTG